VLSCNLVAPRFASEDDLLAGSELRMRSHIKSKRRQLYASELFELRLDVTCVTLLRAPQDSPGFLDLLDSRETSIAAELQEMYRRYRQEVETDITSQLDSRLDALVEHGQELRQAWFQEQQSALDVRSHDSAREASQKHLEERHKMRKRRDEKEHQLEAFCRSLYGKWCDLRQIRQDQGFVSTPWRLRAQPEEHDQQSDLARRARNIEAEVEEVSFLQGTLDPDRVRLNVEHQWDMSKRPPGTLSYRFEVFAGEAVTPTETLRSIARMSDEASNEIQRRRLARRTRARVVCKIGDRIVGMTPVFQLHWETWSTASASQLEAAVAHGSGSLPPLHSFDLAVHMMPQSVTLIVYVANHGWWHPLLAPWRNRWYPTLEMEVEIPDREGRRVTHAAVLDQVLRFGPLITGGDLGPEELGRTTTSYGKKFEEDFDSGGSFSGQVMARVSWPGLGRDHGFVVPPPRPPMLNSEATKAAPAVSCFPCRFAGGHNARMMQRRNSLEGTLAARTAADDRLAGLRYDPQDPENARMLLESPTPLALPGYDVSRLGWLHCRLGDSDHAHLQKHQRVTKLLERASREGVDTEHLLVPAFAREVRKHDDTMDEDATGSGSELKRLVGKPNVVTQSQKDLLRRVRRRVRKAAHVKTHLSYKCIVNEHGEEAEPGNFFQNIEKLLKVVEPHRALRPRGGRRKQEASVRSVRIYVSVARVYHAPVRREDPEDAGGMGGGVVGALERSRRGSPEQQLQQLQGSYPGGPLPSRAPGAFGGGQEQDMAALLGPLSVFGAYSHGLPQGFLPQVFVEMCLEDVDGNVLRCETSPVAPSTDPDINQMLSLTLKLGDNLDVAKDAIKAFRGTLAFSVFDDVTIREPERGGETRLRHQRRLLGRFELPWATLYHAPKCNVKGHFRVAQPMVTCGYQASPIPSGSERPGSHGVADSDTNLAAAQAAGAAGLSAERPEPEPMYISLDITMDPELIPPDSIQPQIVRGKEPSVLLKRVQEWLDSFKHDKDKKVLALGTDLDGKSRLICRFVRPQRPPNHIRPEDPFAIEAAARFVSLIPFLADHDLFPELNDVWCTDQEFLQLQCGDWEEHCILLCNYFNFIDMYRQQFVSGYHSCSVQSCCCLCDVLPEGEIMMVLRRDANTGHCEFWHAVRGECYFVPKWTPPGFMERICPSRSPRPGADDKPGTLGGGSGGEASGVVEALLATPAAPVQRVHIAFNSDNVWANLQHRPGRDPLHKMGFDLEDRSRWKPLFKNADELKRLSKSAQPQAAPSALLPSLRRAPAAVLRSSQSLAAAAVTAAFAAGRSSLLGFGGARPGVADAGHSENPWLEDPTQALKYEGPDVLHAHYLERRLEGQLERDIIEHRAMGSITGVHRVTKFNRVIADRLSALLEELEILASCRRPCGSEAAFPLRSHAAPPVSLQVVQQRTQEIESDFQKMGRPGRCVFGVPFNHSYTEVLDKMLVKQIWEEVRDSRILEMGNESPEFAIKVRVFPYANRIFSIWAFVACATGGD